MPETMIATICALCGPGPGCGIECHVEDGRLVRVEGMEDAPLNKGTLCAKAYGSAQWLYSPQRLTHPLRRVGKKGEGKFERISWDEALDTVAAKLAEHKEMYGARSLAVLSPQARSCKEYVLRFLHDYGSPNSGHSAICFVQRAFGMAHTLGRADFHTTPDFEHAEVIVVWGANPVNAFTAMGLLRRLLAARERGAKLIVIKPEMQADAAKADVWLPVRPGADDALALAMLHVIVTERLYDEEFVAAWCYGFDELVEHVQGHSPEWAEPITGLSAERIREVARLYANAGAACILPGNAFDQTAASNHAVRAVAILMAITGNIDRPGGNIAPGPPSMPPLNPVFPRERLTQQAVDDLVAPEMPKPMQPFLEGTSSAYYGCLDAVLTGDPAPIKSIIAPGTQPTVITRGPRRVIEALEALEFFVVVDVMETASMPWADVVIPVATTYESDHPFEVRMTGEGMWLMARNKVVEPLGDYKSDYEFWLDLACRMGYGDDFWNGDIEACMDWQLQNLGITMKELREHPAGIVYKPNPPQFEKFAQTFSTPSLRFSGEPYLPQAKVAIYNTTYEENGFSPLPEWVEPPESPTGTPELVERYPLTLFDTHTTDVFNHGWLHNVPCLREVHPDPWIHIHPETALARGIEDGDWVVVESPHGFIRVRAQHFPGIRPDTVMGIHGCWQSCEELGLPGQALLDGGANINLLYSIDPDKAFDPVVSAMAKQTLVQIRRMDADAGGGAGLAQPKLTVPAAASPSAAAPPLPHVAVAGPGPGQVGFLFDEGRCVDCRTCEVACKATRDVEPGVNWRHVKEEWTGEYPTPAVSYFSLSCMHCAAPECLAACPAGAICKRDEDGVVLVDPEKCDGPSGCRECLAACPYDVPQFGSGGGMQKCDYCAGAGHEPACTRSCPAGAIASGRLEDLRAQAAGKTVRELRSAGGPSIVVVH
jgi:anaerobic selenocysteine-containing dehydrogenase/Fe-S-cluster-containing dehydrogenase component